MGAPGCFCQSCRYGRARASRWRTVGLVVMFVAAMLATGVVFACDEVPASEPVPLSVALAHLAVGLLALWGFVVILNFLARRLGNSL